MTTATTPGPWSHRAAAAHRFRERLLSGVRDPASLGVSLALHGSLALFSLISLDFASPPPRRPEPRMRMLEVSIAGGEGTRTATPKLAAPRASEKPPTTPSSVGKVDQEAVEERPAANVADAPSSGSSPDAPPASDAGSPDAGGLVWTPPAPRPNAAGASPSGSTSEATRVVMPQVALAEGASDAVLVSYDQARYSDAAAIGDARRLGSEGRITMSVYVDAEGGVTQCAVTVTSGSQVFDDRACALVRSYRYRAAQDAKGIPHPSIVSEVLEWSRDGVDAPAGATTSDGAVAPGPAPMPRVALPNR